MANSVMTVMDNFKYISKTFKLWFLQKIKYFNLFGTEKPFFLSLFVYNLGMKTFIHFLLHNN